MSADDTLKQIAQQLRTGKSHVSVTVRELLALFGAQRRGFYVVQHIKDSLSDAGLATRPDFEGVWIDGLIELILFETAPTAEVIDTKISDAAPAALPISRRDSTNRIGKFPAANKALVSVKPNDPIETAITLMMKNDFSHLPVMTSERDVKGVVGWQSIGSRLALGKSCAEVRECMEAANVIDADASLFEAMDRILHHQYVLVSDDTKRISGIVTTYDLSLQFRQLTEPFLLLGEIENHIRKIIEKGNFSANQLKACCDPDDEERSVSRVSDLTLGECIRLLENPDNWKQIGLRVDRREFVRSLDNVRAIRNDVMHFEPDPLSDESLDTLRRFDQFLRKLTMVMGY